MHGVDESLCFYNMNQWHKWANVVSTLFVETMNIHIYYQKLIFGRTKYISFGFEFTERSLVSLCVSF